MPISFLKVGESHDLRNILIENAHNFETCAASKNVVDGGALLQQVSWSKNCSYSEVIDQ